MALLINVAIFYFKIPTDSRVKISNPQNADSQTLSELCVYTHTHTHKLHISTNQ